MLLHPTSPTRPRMTIQIGESHVIRHKDDSDQARVRHKLSTSGARFPRLLRSQASSDARDNTVAVIAQIVPDSGRVGLPI